MVDRPARDRLAESLRHCISGRISIFKCHDAADLRSPDASIPAVAEFVAGLVDDFGSSYLRGKRAATPEMKKFAARCVVFLHSDFEYEWPPFSEQNLHCFFRPVPLIGAAVGFLCLLFANWELNAGRLYPCLAAAGAGGTSILIAAGVAYRAHRQALRRFHAAGDFAVWPFVRRSDLEEAAKKPRLFAGRARA